jgi:hypothetical protein
MKVPQETKTRTIPGQSTHEFIKKMWYCSDIKRNEVTLFAGKQMEC